MRSLISLLLPVLVAVFTGMVIYFDEDYGLKVLNINAKRCVCVCVDPVAEYEQSSHFKTAGFPECYFHKLWRPAEAQAL